MIDEKTLDQIYTHLSELEQENRDLKNQLNQYRQSIIEVCRCSGFSSWYNFTEWVFRYFKEVPPLSEITTKINIQARSHGSLKSTCQKLFCVNEILPSIQEEQFQSTVSEKSLQETLRNLSNKISHNQLQDWKNETLSFQKIIKRDSSTIVMENVQLRRQICMLRKQSQSTKESLFILANIIQQQQKHSIKNPGLVLSSI